MKTKLSKIYKTLKNSGVVFTLTNAKGGPGKTTLSFHLAEAFNSCGLKTLYIDNDTQGNSSQLALGFEGLPTDEMLREQKYLSGADLFDESLPEDFSVYEAKENLFLLPSTNRLTLVDKLDLSSLLNMYDHLQYIKDKFKFDVVVIDTPPKPDNLQLASQLAANKLVMPVVLDPFSLKGLADTNEKLSQLCGHVGLDMPTLYIAPNQVNSKSPNEMKSLEKLYQDFENSKAIVLPPMYQFQVTKDSITTATPVWKNYSSNGRKARDNFFALVLALIGVK